MIVGEEEQRVAGDLGELRDVFGRLGQHEAGDDVICAKQRGVAQQLAKFFTGSWIGGRAEKAQDHPAPRADMQIECAPGHE